MYFTICYGACRLHSSLIKIKQFEVASGCPEINPIFSGELSLIGSYSYHGRMIDWPMVEMPTTAGDY